MSSSRSLASARNKRANTVSNIPTVSNISTGSTTTVKSSQSSVLEHPEKSMASAQFPSGKLALPQVINIISDRLNTLELFMETTANIIDDIKEFHTKTTDKYVVDSDVFNSIISRIDALEGKNVTTRNDVVNNANISDIVTPMRVTQDIDELKVHLIRLQTYVMETNAKMQDLVFSNANTPLLSFSEVFSESTNGQHPFTSDQVPTPPTLMRSMTAGTAIGPNSAPNNSDSITPIALKSNHNPQEVHFSNSIESGSEDGEVSEILGDR